MRPNPPNFTKERVICTYFVTKDEAADLLRKFRQIRQASGEAIAFLEHMFQLQNKGLCDDTYDPDEYLERWISYNHDRGSNHEEITLPRDGQ